MSTVRQSPHLLSRLVLARRVSVAVWIPSLVAVLTVALAFAMSSLINQWIPTPLVFFLGAIGFSAWYAGARAGWLALLLSVVTADFFIVAPVFSLELTEAGLIQLTSFTLVASVLIFFITGSEHSLAQLQALVDERTRGLAETLATTRNQARLLDLARDAIFVRDFAARALTFWNRGAEQLYGWTRDEVLGRNPHELLQTQFPKPLDGVMADLLRDGYWEGELVHTCKDGTHLTVFSRWALVRGERGEPVEFLEINTDVTAQKRAEADRAAREAAEAVATRTALLAESSTILSKGGLDPDVTVHALAEWLAETVGDSCTVRLISADGQWLRPVALGCPDPVRKVAAERVMGGVPLRGSDPPYTDVVSTGQAVLVPYVDQTRLWLSLHPEHQAYFAQFPPASMLIVPMRVGDRVIGTMLLLRYMDGRPFTRDDEALIQNIADRAALSVENARLYQEATLTLKTRDEFLAVAAHELKTPITAARLATDLFIRTIRGSPPDTERLGRLAEAIRTQNLKLARLVEQLLDVSRLQAGRLVLAPEEIDLVELVRSVVASFEARNTGRGVSVRAPIELGAWADSLRMEQVLVNVLDNAHKFSPARTPIEIEVAPMAPSEACISIRDHGPGISEEDRERIFERYFQVETRRAEAGLGLGLHISRQIVELHGGQISVECPDNGGTRFTIRVPREPGSGVSDDLKSARSERSGIERDGARQAPPPPSAH